MVLNAHLAQHLGLQLSRNGALVVNSIRAAEDDYLLSSPSVQSGRAPSTELRRRNGPQLQQSSVSGKHNPDFVSTDKIISSSDVSLQRKSLLINPDDLYLQPHRRKSLCEQILEFIFTY
jgi:hypothetical protein